MDVKEAIFTKKITEVIAKSEKKIGKKLDEIVFDIYLFNKLIFPLYLKALLSLCCKNIHN